MKYPITEQLLHEYEVELEKDGKHISDSQRKYAAICAALINEAYTAGYYEALKAAGKGDGKQ